MLSFHGKLYCAGESQDILVRAKKILCNTQLNNKASGRKDLDNLYILSLENLLRITALYGS